MVLPVNCISVKLFFLRIGHVMFMVSYFYILIFFWPKVWNSFCLSHFHYQRKGGTLHGATLYSPKNLAKCPCHTYYNLRVFPLPGKVSSFFHFNLYNWDKIQKKKKKTDTFASCTCHNLTFLISVIPHLFLKLFSTNTKKCSGLSFSQCIFQAKGTLSEESCRAVYLGAEDEAQKGQRSPWSTSTEICF